MDPTACLHRILASLRAKDRDEAIDALRDLADWIENRGALPNVPTVRLSQAGGINAWYDSSLDGTDAP